MGNATRSTQGIKNIGLILIIGLSLLYAVFRQRVSEKYIQLSFLHFPIFVGEIVLGICLLLFGVMLFLDYRSKKFHLDGYYTGLLAYAGWIVINALSGYAQSGAYALRNAALFYYALFAVLGFSFYNKEFFGKRVVWILIVGMFTLASRDAITVYYRVPFILILLFLLLSLENRWLTIAGVALLVGMLLVKFQGAAFVHRSHVAGILGTMTFLFLFGLRYLSKNNTLGRKLLIGFFIFAVLGVLSFVDHNVRKSFALKAIIAEYEHFDGYIQNNKHLFIFRDVKPNLYQEDAVKYGRRTLTAEEQAMKYNPYPDLAMVWPGGEPGRPRPQNVSNFETEPPVENEDSQFLSRLIPKQQGRNIGQSRNQILFRVFIWRDMLDDLKYDPYRFIFGVGFAKPQRSHSIEILGWGRQEWGRDGWISPHNSFLNMIYRGGFVGWMMIAVIIVLIIRMTRGFGRLKLLTSGLLVAGLVYWFVVCNFLVFWEVPHTAIPFWSYLGVLCAYWKDQTRTIHSLP